MFSEKNTFSCTPQREVCSFLPSAVITMEEKWAFSLFCIYLPSRS